MRVVHIALLLLAPLFACESSPIVELCDNGIDDDFNELIDCEDLEVCAADPACAGEVVCDDNLDNDGNGLTDCADPRCADLDHCVDAGS